jgi:heme/copper-type cytochrome/quinol oxidase subunit 3
LSANPIQPDPDRAGQRLGVPHAVLGMLIFVVCEIMFFGGLITAYLVGSAGQAWPPPGQLSFPVQTTAFNTAVLLFSGWFMYRAGTAQRDTDQKMPPSQWSTPIDTGRATRNLGISAFLGLFFVVFQGVEWTRLISHGLTMRSSYYLENVFLPSQRQEISWLKGKKVATLTTPGAIAKPKLFENNLKEQGAEIVHTETHDNLRKFTQRQEIIALVNRAKDSGAVAIITPLKSDDIKLIEEPNENLQHFPGVLKIDRLDLPIYYTHGSTYGSLFYLIIGAHALHVMIALVVLLFVYTRLKQGRLTNGAFGAARVFWYFVVGLWPVLYILVYLL